MSENREQVSENNEFQVLLKRYREMREEEVPSFFDVEEFEQIIDYYLDEFQLEEAEQAASLGNKQHPTSVELKYKCIQISIEQGHPKKALRLLQEIPAWENNNPELYFLKGTALCMIGRHREAESDFDRALDITDEDTFDALINISIAFENARRYELAIKYLVKAWEIDPLNLSVLFDLGYFHERVDKFEKSAGFYKAYLDQDPFSDNVWYNLGIVYHRLERFSEAVEAYDFSIALNPDYASAYFNKANVWADAGEYQKAIACYLEFLDIEPENTQAWCYLGECYEQINEFEKSLESYRRLIEIDNTDAEGWFGAGMAYYRKNMIGEAITYILKAIEFDDQNTDYWLNLGYAYEEAGMAEEALKCYFFVVRKDKREKDGWLSFTELMMKEGDFRKAIPFLDEAVSHHPNEESFRMKLAVCHLMAGDPGLAEENFRAALKISHHALSEFEYYIRDNRVPEHFRKIIQKFKK